MIRIGSFLLVSFAITMTLKADDQLKSSVMKSAAELREATLKYDNAKALDFMYPAVLKESGGREKILPILDEKTKRQREQGIAFEAIQLGEPGEIYSEGDNLFVIIPNTSVVTAPKLKMIEKAYLIGISLDKGKKWFFTQASHGQDIAPLLKLLPKLPEKLVLPPLEKAEFIELEK